MRRKSPNKKKSFTLIEVLVVVIIIGILAGIAIPRFIKTAEKARGEEALTNLRLIFAGERMYRLDNNIYCSALKDEGAGGLSPEYIEDTTTPARQKYFTLILSGVVPPNYDAFTATATRKIGIYKDEWIQIDETETFTKSPGWPWLP